MSRFGHRTWHLWAFTFAVAAVLVLVVVVTTR